MSSDKKRRLEQTIAALQGRWGGPVVRRGAPAMASVPCLPTTFPQLDKALGHGGLPHGRISELIGIPTSGMATLALKIAAAAQTDDGVVVYLDLERTFDPDYAARCGVALERLVLVRPTNARQALLLLHDFVAGGGFRLLIFDTPYRLLTEETAVERLSATLGRLVGALGKSDGVLLFLTALPPGSSGAASDYPPQSTLPHYATVRLRVQRARWLYHRRDIHGYEAEVAIVKNKLGPVDRHVLLTLTFDM